MLDVKTGGNVLELRKFVIPEIILGLDARLLTGRYMAHFGAKNPMIVTDKQVRDHEWFKQIIESIEKGCDKYALFDDVTPNPKDYEVMMGAELFLSNDCDIIIAIGGGSPMDCAKGISIVATNGGHILDYEGVDQIRLPGPPLICIPSTAGASADVSQFAIILDTVAKVKKAIISKKVVPDLALLDPCALMTMDPYLSACTAMDALTHAMEAYVSNAQSSLTDVHALEAIRLISRNIKEAVWGEKNLETMYQMMLGSLQAGLAFSNASLGAVHALAHSLGGLLQLSHGECNSILLAPVIEMNFDASPQRFMEIARQLGLEVSGCSQDEAKNMLVAKINDIRESVGIKAHIESGGTTINESILKKLVQNALDDPCMITNPRNLTEHEVMSIYERILQ